MGYVELGRFSHRSKGTSSRASRVSSAQARARQAAQMRARKAAQEAAARKAQEAAARKAAQEAAARKAAQEVAARKAAQEAAARKAAQEAAARKAAYESARKTAQERARQAEIKKAALAEAAKKEQRERAALQERARREEAAQEALEARERALSQASAREAAEYTTVELLPEVSSLRTEVDAQQVKTAVKQAEDARRNLLEVSSRHEDGLASEAELVKAENLVAVSEDQLDKVAAPSEKQRMPYPQIIEPPSLQVREAEPVQGKEFPWALAGLAGVGALFFISKARRKR